MSETTSGATVVLIPDDVRVWDEADGLTLADAPDINGSGDQTGGLGPL